MKKLQDTRESQKKTSFLQGFVSLKQQVSGSKSHNWPLEIINSHYDDK